MTIGPNGDIVVAGRPVQGVVLIDAATGVAASRDAPLPVVMSSTSGTLRFFRPTLDGAAESNTTAGMNVNGSVTPQQFWRSAGPNGTLLSRFVVVVEDAGSSEVGNFGALTALTNGLTCGVHNGTSYTQTVFSSVQTNGGFREIATGVDDIYFLPATGGRQNFMFSMERLFGAALWIPPGSRLQVTVADNLTGLSRLWFRCTGVDL